MAGWNAVCLIAVLAAGCGSAPRRAEAVSARPDMRAEAPVGMQGSLPQTTAPRRGGFYKDDGPGDNPPPNLDAIPDAEPKLEPLNRFANNPYSVLGQTYTPANALAPYTERGTASWYGRMFHGKRTSSGEPYDMYGMTGAHPTLPIPSYARVTNLNNGRSVVVRVNDRGPFHPGRVMDLSYTAAYKLGYADVGSAPVEVSLVLPEDVAFVPTSKPVPPMRRAAAPASRPAPARQAPVDVAATGSLPPDPIDVAPADPGSGVFLQLGAFASRTNAEHFRTFVESELDWVKERVVVLALDGKFRLHLGPYATQSEARSSAERIAAKIKLRPFVVMR
ncbi:MAG: septal ring lytic transglycosylase RlpA family protein [Zoogloea sp.]|nr:septal ring lytic transglycosylase RlpA family protein [Zoogloea sp.]